jgi:cbb3-type cytochrome oxidase subunit 3
MRLTDIMSNAGLAVYAELGLVLFLAAFVAIAIRLFRPSDKRRHDEAAHLPFDDGTRGNASRTGSKS